MGLLASPRSCPDYVENLKSSLVEHIDFEEENLFALFSMAMHFCRNCEVEEWCFAVFQQLVKVMPMWRDCETEFFNILPEAYKIAPLLVIRTMPAWFAMLLEWKNVNGRNEVMRWMMEHVFATGKGADLSPFEAERVSQARKLVKDCDLNLKEGHNEGWAITRYEGTIKFVRTVVAYLQAVQTKARALRGVDIKLQTEVDEIHSAGTMGLYLWCAGLWSAIYAGWRERRRDDTF